MDVLARIGARVRELRKSRGLSQEDLAERASLHQTYIGGIERGERNPSLKSIEKIANAFEVDIGELLIFAEKEEEKMLLEISELLRGKKKRELKLAAKILRDIFEWVKRE